MFKVPIPGIDETNLISNSQAGQDLFVVAMMQGAKKRTFLEIGAGSPTKGNNTYLLEHFFDWSGVSIDFSDCWPTVIPRKLKFELFYNSIKDPSWPVAEQLSDLPEHIQEECLTVHNYDFHVGQVPENPTKGKCDWKNIRPNTQFFLANAISFDYTKLNQFYWYLQVDIDPPLNNWLVLEKLVTTKEFAVITYEHDIWRKTAESKLAKSNAQTLLQDLGYVLVADNVTVKPTKDNIKDAPLYFEDWYVNPKYVDQKIIDAYKCLGPNLTKYYTEILFKR